MAASKKSSSPTKERFVALLRGLNVGGKNRLAMKDLAAAFTACGCTNVTTFIQSGNVLFDASASVAAKLRADVPAKILSAHGLTTPVVLRTREELARVPRNNPWPDRAALDRAGSDGGAAPSPLLNVLFLADTPTPDAAAGLDPNRSPGDEYALVGREVYLWLRRGVADSKLTNAYFDKQLGTTSTGRNWRTITKLIELCG
ncbi:MAG: DUF1697 domain-containing protein [Polyangiaceae bacterium]